MVSMDLEIQVTDRKESLWKTLSGLQTILKSEYLPDAVYDTCYFLNNGKEISRIYVLLDQVSIHDKNTWQKTMVFLKDNMVQLEAFFSNYRDILEE